MQITIWNPAFRFLSLPAKITGLTPGAAFELWVMERPHIDRGHLDFFDCFAANGIAWSARSASATFQLTECCVGFDDVAAQFASADLRSGPFFFANAAGRSASVGDPFFQAGCGLMRTQLAEAAHVVGESFFYRILGPGRTTARSSRTRVPPMSVGLRRQNMCSSHGPAPRFRPGFCPLGLSVDGLAALALRWMLARQLPVRAAWPPSLRTDKLNLPTRRRTVLPLHQAGGPPSGCHGTAAVR